MAQKLMGKARLNRSKDCRDCEEATIHQTGSSLWVSCKFQKGWRDINAECNLPVKTIKESLEIQGLYPVKNSSQSYWTLKAICELSKFREHKKKGKTIK